MSSRAKGAATPPSAAIISAPMDVPSDMRPVATGDFVKTPLPHLFVFLAERRLQGSLVIHGEDDSESTVFFSSGAPAKVMTSYPGTHLGRALLQLGFIDDDILQTTLATMHQTGDLHGQILISLGKIDDAQLVAGLREQMMRRLLKMFEKLGDKSTYAFYNAVNLLDDFGGSEVTPIDPFRVIWEGLHLRPNDRSIEPTLARLGSAPVRPHGGADLRRFGFGPPEWKVIELLQVRATSLEQVLELNIMPVRQLKLLMYALLITKSIEVAPVAAPAPAEATPPPAPIPPRQPSTPDDAPPSSARPQGVPMARVKLKSAAVPNPATQRASTHSASREEILERAQTIEKEDFFQVLGISRTDPPDVVRSAYFALAKRWHPDRMPTELEDVRDEAAKVFGRISEAFQTISDVEQRAQYLELIQRDMSEADEAAKVQQVIEATIDFQKGEVFVRKRDFEKAEKHARRAYENDPEQPDHIALFAWVFANQPERYAKRDFAEPLALLDQAIRMQAKCERAYYYRAMLNKLLGKEAQAIRDFRVAADLNPRNIDAVREVRIAGMRGTAHSGSEAKTERTRTGRGRDNKQKQSTDEGKPIDWKQDSVGSIVGKLFKRK